MAEIQVTDEGNIIEIIQGRDLTVVMPVENGVEIEKLRFIQLADTPNSYADAAGKLLLVNEDGDGIIFSKNYSTFLDLKDTPSSYENEAGKMVVVNSNGTGLRFINFVSGDVQIENFTQLADVPNNYTGKANYLVSVNTNEDGLTFIQQDNILPDQQYVIPGSYKYPQFVINSKGIITNIQEGEPFEFDEFDLNKLLIGDGSTTPAQLELGLNNQVLQTSSSSGRPHWVYLSRLIDNEGNPLLIASSASSSSTGILYIENSSSQTTIKTDSGQQIKIGNSSPVLLAGNTEVTGVFTADLTSLFKGIATFEKKIIAENNIDVGGSLNVTGNITTDGAISANGNITTSNGGVTANGNITTQRNLAVAGTAQISGDVLLGEDLEVRGDATIAKTLSVTKAATFSEGITVTGDSSITGNTTITGNLTATGTASIGSDTTIAGDLTVGDIAGSGNYSAASGVNINPGSGVINVTGVNAATYSGRITHDNDLITKKYLEDHQVVVTNSYEKTQTYTISSSAVTISIPENSQIVEINFGLNSNLNAEAKLQIEDSDLITLFDASDCPYLDSEGLKIFVNKEVSSSNYEITATILDYSFGEGTIYVTYFKGNS